jgi:hypothetical protein
VARFAGPTRLLAARGAARIRVGPMVEHDPMPDSGDDGRSVPPVAGRPIGADDSVLDTPNCPRCLMRMEAVESTSGEPYWSCTECGQIVLA